MMAKYTNQPIEIHLLITARTDTTYFHEYIYPYAKLDFIKGRLKFRDLTGVSKKPTSAPFPSIVCIYKHAWEMMLMGLGYTYSEGCLSMVEHILYVAETHEEGASHSCASEKQGVKWF